MQNKNEALDCDLLENLYQEYRGKLGNFLFKAGAINDEAIEGALEIFEGYAREIKRRSLELQS